MTGRTIGVLVCMAVLAFGALVFSDWGLRSQNQWIGAEAKKGNNTQPFLASWVFPMSQRARLQAKGIIENADNADSQSARANLLFEAVDLLKNKDDAEQRADLLRQICEECPDTPRSAEAWALRLRAKLDEKPPADPRAEMEQLLECIRRFGVGKGKVSPKPIQGAAKAMKRRFPKQAKTLKAALDAATPKPPKKKPRKKSKKNSKKKK